MTYYLNHNRTKTINVSVPHLLTARVSLSKLSDNLYNIVVSKYSGIRSLFGKEHYRTIAIQNIATPAVVVGISTRRSRIEFACIWKEMQRPVLRQSMICNRVNISINSHFLVTPYSFRKLYFPMFPSLLIWAQSQL